MVMRGTTIRIFLVDGTPQGLRVADKTGWTGSCLAFSRADYARARQRGELSGTGVYVLIGPDPEQPERQRVYVGEGDEVRTRLDQHQRTKDFWTNGYVLTSKDGSLNKAHIRYLEARLIALAQTAGRVALDNGTAPSYRGLSEAEVADMEGYLDEVVVMLPLLRVDAFDPLQTAPTPSKDSVTATGTAESTGLLKSYSLTAPLTQAEGRDTRRPRRSAQKVQRPGKRAPHADRRAAARRPSGPACPAGRTRPSQGARK